MKWDDNIANDPYEEYRDQPPGCRDTFIAVLIGIALCVFIAVCSSCKVQNVPVNTKDSVRIEIRHDSVYVYQHDSIFRDRWRNGDTVFVTVEKWQTRYKDKVIEIHDTLSTTDVQYIKEKYTPAYYKNTSAGFWVLLLILLAIVGWRVGRLIVKIKSGGIL